MCGQLLVIREKRTLPKKVITLPAPQKQGFVDWNTNEVREGLYFYSITNGKKVIGSGKVVIAH